jgi:hypothetical protein
LANRFFVPSSGEPQFLDGLTAKKQSGSAATLSCVFRGNPEVTVKWQKDGADVPLGENIKMTSTPWGQPFFVNHRLEFLSVSRNDNGSYTCNGSNILGFSVAVRDLIVLGECNPINPLVNITVQ